MMSRTRRRRCCAADYGLSCEIVRVLLSRGADVTATSASGDSAEDYARATLDRPVVASIEDAVAEYDYDSAAQAIQYWDDLEKPWCPRGRGRKHHRAAFRRPRRRLLETVRRRVAGRAPPAAAALLGGPRLSVDHHRPPNSASACRQSRSFEATSGCKVTPRKITRTRGMNGGLEKR